MNDIAKDSEVVLTAISNLDESIEHHGILGQKWGIENGPPYPLSNSQRTAKQRKLNPVSEAIKNMEKRAEEKRMAKEASEAELNKKKAFKSMSDDELRSYINRAKLEQEYKSYVLPKEKENTIAKATKEALATVGKKTVNEIVIPVTVAKMKNFVIGVMESSGKYSTDQINAFRKSLNMAEASGATVKNVLDMDLRKANASDVRKFKEIMNDMVSIEKGRREYNKILNPSDPSIIDLDNVSYEKLLKNDPESVDATLKALRNAESILQTKYNLDTEQYKKTKGGETEVKEETKKETKKEEKKKDPVDYESKLRDATDEMKSKYNMSDDDYDDYISNLLKKIPEGA